jgi:hypothetical protein
MPDGDPAGVVAALIAAFQSSGDAALILSPHAVAAASDAFATLGPHGLREPVKQAVLRTVSILGAFHWARHQVLPEGREQPDLQRAFLFYTTVYKHNPDAVPPPLRLLIDRARPRPPAVGRPGEPDPAALNASAVALMRRAEATGAYGGADEAARLLVRAVSLAAAADPARAEYLSNLGRVYRDLFRRDRDPARLDDAIAANRQALAATGEGDPARPLRLFNTGHLLRDKYEQVGDPAAAAEAASHLRAAARAAPRASPHRPMFLASAGSALCDASELNGDDAMFAEGVVLLREAAVSAPADDERRLAYLRNLAKVARARYLRTSDATARDAAIDAYQQAAAASSPGPDRVPYVQAAMALAVLRAEDTRDAADIGQAGHAAGEALALLPLHAAERARVLVAQARIGALRFGLTGDPADLGAAAASYRQAMAVARDPADLRASRAGLSDVLWTLYQRTGEQTWLNQTVTAARQATTERPPGDGAPTLADLTLLAIALTERFRRTGARTALDEAIGALRRAVDLADTAQRPLAWSNLADALWEGARQRHDRGMLADAARLLRDSVRSCPQEDPRRAGFLAHLCRALAETFGWTGEQVALDQAIAAGRDGLAAARAQGTDQIPCLTNLGVALTRRFEHFGDAASLDEAIDTLGSAAAAPSGSPRDRAALLVSLGNALVMRCQRNDDASDLDDGVNALRAAAGQLPVGHTDRPVMLGNLGCALLLRSARPDGGAALDEAANVLREAADATPDDHLTRPIYLANLGGALVARFRRRHDLSDLDGALAALRQVADSRALDRTAVSRSAYLTTMARALMEDAVRKRHQGPLAGAITMLRAAAGAGPAPTADRVQAACEWADLAATADLSAAADGYATAVGLLDMLAWRGLRRVDQELLLARFSGVAGDAAAAAIAAGQPGRAVELLEQGRGVLLAQAIGARAAYDALRRQAPALADRLNAIHDALEPPLRRGQVPLTVPAGDPQRTSDRRPALTRERTALLAEIRALPGFAEFLRPPSAAGLLSAAGRGPVVLVNVSRHRCDALALTSGGVRLIQLPDLHHGDVGARVSSFLGALDTLRSRQGAGTDPVGVAADLVAAGDVLTDTLRWCWDVITGPVLDGLGITGRPATGRPWPRIWWCPTGWLSFLPLHAAGYHDTQDAAVPATVLDRVVSSYTPTVRALSHAARDCPDPPGALDAPLVVSMPVTPAATDLPDSQREAGDLLVGYPDSLVLTGPEATRGAVLSAVPYANWMHFACHGVQDRARPCHTGLLLHDGPLTIHEIAAGIAGQADLAYLSACETLGPSGGGAELPDEAVTLATAVQLARFRHVVGALWPIADGIAPDMARRVYAAIREHGVRETAMAVHEAVRALRRNSPDAPAVWAPYVHVGP